MVMERRVRSIVLTRTPEMRNTIGIASRPLPINDLRLVCSASRSLRAAPAPAPLREQPAFANGVSDEFVLPPPYNSGAFSTSSLIDRLQCLRYDAGGVGRRGRECYERQPRLEVVRIERVIYSCSCSASSFCLPR